MKAILALEDGTQFVGQSIGAAGTCIGEVVFDTGMTGYLEVLTDPSFAGYLITMTYPLIGNYGVNTEDQESSKPYAKGFIVRELCDEPSNFRSQETLNSFLIRKNIIGIQGIDTRALTRILRNKGTMNGVISTDPDFIQEDWIEKIHNYKISNPVEQVTSKEVQHIEGTGRRVAILDYGAKTSIIHCLKKRNCDLFIFPASSEANDILSVEPDGIMLSNGPGDPKDCAFQIDVLKKLIGKKPMFGICLGHQLTALAYGADTGKLKYGHRGGNHPVKDLAKDRTYITSQNHGYVVLAEKLDSKKAVVSHININDGTVEGIRYTDTPTFTVQFHPEASPGPKETEYLFDEFMALIDMYKK
ncbi:MAG: carbamoyl phosphate synthase small subunit [Clostridiaceae bacterium]|nr:carbamoyl phosphate synthase small subunit [Clostridiaceae bacterium]